MFLLKSLIYSTIAFEGALEQLSSTNSNFRPMPRNVGRKLSKAGGGTKTQRIAMKFGVHVIDLREHQRSIDELAQRKKNGTP